MTEEEYRAEQEERARLLDEINQLQNAIYNAQVEQAQLQAELDTLVENMGILSRNAEIAGNASRRRIDEGHRHTAVAEQDVSDLYYAIDTMVNSYFQFKEMATASKNVSEATDEYFTKFKFYNKLRRITLGYTIGLDQNFATSEVMRKQVEKIYLQNTDYWLAYAAAAVMLWASDEKEAAVRAVNKAVYMDYSAASVFFLLINLRFTRIDPAKKWYLHYLDRVDLDHLGNEWEHLLEAYLSGVFGVDPEFSGIVEKCFLDMFSQLESMHPQFGTEIADHTEEYADKLLHITSHEFESLRRYCPEYGEMKKLLSTAEKNAVLTERFRVMWSEEGTEQLNIYERIEDILYDLISSMDKEEEKVYKKIKLNKYILQAKGDVTEARKAFDHEFAAREKTTLADLLFRWGFADEADNVDIRVRRFSLGYLKKYILRGFAQFGEHYRKREKETYPITIDDWTGECDESSYQKSSESLYKHYMKNRVRNLLADQYVIIFLVMLAASLVSLILCAVSFNKFILVAGILLGVAGGFLLWRRIVDLDEILARKREKGFGILRMCIEEIGKWRQIYKAADAQNNDLVKLFEEIEDY